MPRIFAIQRDETFKSISNQLNRMRKRNELVDFTLFNDQDDSVNGHMIVMALSCPRIKELLDTFSDQRRLLLRGVNAEALEQLITFMYIGEIHITDSNAHGVYLGAIELAMTPLESVCLDYLGIDQVFWDNSLQTFTINRRSG